MVNLDNQPLLVLYYVTSNPIGCRESVAGYWWRLLYGDFELGAKTVLLQVLA
jgi:hypothetical protein